MVRFVLALTTGSSGRARDVLTALHFLAARVQLDPGCRDVSAVGGPGSQVRYTEEWVSEADLQRRVRSHSFASILEVIEFAARPPVVEFHVNGMVRDLSYVTEVRGPHPVLGFTNSRTVKR